MLPAVMLAHLAESERRSAMPLSAFVDTITPVANRRIAQDGRCSSEQLLKDS